MKGIFKRTFIFLTWLLSKSTPKRKNRWLFCPIHYAGRMDGNIQALYSYIAANDLGVDVRVRDIRVQRLNSQWIQFLSIPNLWKLLVDVFQISRSELVITDAQFYLQHLDIKLAQLWHGTGFKNIQALNKLQNRNLNFSDRLVLVVATSEADKDRKVKSFQTENVFVTGNPRNDVLFHEHPYPKDALSKQYDIDETKKWILYAPTFRSHKQKQPFTIEEWQQLSKLCKYEGYVFLVKKHPADNQLFVPNNLSNVVDITSTSVGTQEVLVASDVLISDYSGIVTDYALLGRPMLFFTYDFEEYVCGSRDFYYDLDVVLPGPFVNSYAEMSEVLTNLDYFVDKYTPSWKEFKDRFHRYKDGHSSERVFETLARL